MSGPTIYARLMETRIRHPLAEARELVERLHPTDALLNELEEVIRQAYIAGVSDGFAQGVAACTEQTPSEPKEQA